MAKGLECLYFTVYIELSIKRVDIKNIVRGVLYIYYFHVCECEINIDGCHTIFCVISSNFVLVTLLSFV